MIVIIFALKVLKKTMYLIGSLFEVFELTALDLSRCGAIAFGDGQFLQGLQ